MLVTIDNLTVRRSGNLALSIDSLELSPGVTALLGPNGSGKSTLLHAIAGLLPGTGTVRIDGHDRSEAHRLIAYVLQTQHVAAQLPITAREVISLGRTPSVGALRRLTRTDRAAVEAALARLELTSLADRHLTELSGGERQRVFIAQGLVQDAPILLLDEPVAGLDLASMERIRVAIESERDTGRTVIVATHDLAEAARADAVVLLAGRVVAAGTPAEVLTPTNLRAAYAGRILNLDGSTVVLDDGAHHDHLDLTDVNPHHVEHRHTEAKHHE